MAPKNDAQASSQAERFAALFAGYTGAHGTFRPGQVNNKTGKLEGKSSTVKGSPDYLRHLRGEVSVGVIPLRDDGETAQFGAIDYDNRKMNHQKAEARIRELKLPLVLCRSKSGGGHFYCFCNEPVSATAVRAKLEEWAKLLDMPARVEVFPKQVHREEDDVGTFINLPYFGSERHAIIKGKPASLGEFLDYAEAARTTLKKESEYEEATDNELPEEISDGERNTTLASLAGTLRRRGLSREIIEITLLAVNERHCEPRLSAKEVRGIALSVAKYPPAPAAPPLPRAPTLFPPGSDQSRTGTPENVRALNDRFAVVTEGGRVSIWRPVRDAGRIVYERFREQDFRLHFKNRSVEVATGKDKTKQVQLGDYWLSHPHRRGYEYVTFDPTPGYVPPRGTLNLFRGFSVKPAQGRWDRLDAHLREVICGGVDERYRYLRPWLARLLQQPHRHGEVATVLRGPKGAGKGLVGNALVDLHGQHGLRIDNPTHLTGRFNAHLRDCCFLFVDEGHWAGDKAGESILKGLITEPSLVIEAKYANPVPVRNRLSILMASNSDWVVPASRDERRFFVLDVAGTRIGDWAYFSAIRDELTNGGLAAFLYDMLAEDLEAFNHRDVPITEALQDQVIHSLSPLEQWWHERLEEGCLLSDTLPWDTEMTGDWRVEQVRVTKDALHKDAVAFLDSHRVPRGRDPRSALGRRLRKWLPPGWPREEWTGGPRGGARYVLPPLVECREAFCRGREGLFFAPVEDRTLHLSEADTQALLFRRNGDRSR